MDGTPKSRRQAYLDLLREGEALIADPAMRQRILRPGGGSPLGSGRAPDFLMALEWALYEATGDGRHAAIAHQMLTADRERWQTAGSYHRAAEVLDEFCHHPYAWTYCRLRDAGRLTQGEASAARDVLDQSLRFWQEHPTFHAGSAELDITNLGITPAVGADFAARHIFSGDRAANLRAYADTVWTGYWRLGDCPEDASNYECLHYTYLALWADLRDERDAMQTYARNGAYERALQLVTPMGALLDQGDSFWQSGWAGWVAAFEMGATLLGDERCAWAATRLMDYARRGGYLDSTRAIVARDAAHSDSNTRTIVAMFVQDLYFLSQAYQWCDERVAARQPDGDASAITYRYRVALPDVIAEGSPALTLFPHARGERHEDKVILRGGYDHDDTCVIASLDRRVHHDHEDAGAILSWTQRGSVLLKGPSYQQRQRNAHNLVVTAPAAADPEATLGTVHWVRNLTEGDQRCTMRFIEDFREVAMAGWRLIEHGSHPAAWRRTVIAPRDGAFLAVYDELENRGDDLWAAPLWHTEIVHAMDDWWADCELQRLSARGDWDWTHNRRRLLVSCPLREQALRQIQQTNPDSDDRPPHLALESRLSWPERACLCQVGPLPRGGAVSFLSVLVPHDGDVDGATTAARVRVVAQERDAWCVEIGDETGPGTRLVGMVKPRHRRIIATQRPDHHGYLPGWATAAQPEDVHGDRTSWFTAGDLTTDAELFYVRRSGDQTHVAARRMRAFELGGLRHHASIAPTRAPTRLQTNAEFDLEPGRGRARYWSRYLNPIRVSFGFAPGALTVGGGLNGIATRATIEGDTVVVDVNGLGTIDAQA